MEKERQVTIRLSVSTPAYLSVPLASAVPPQQPPNGQTLPSLSAQHAGPAPSHSSESTSLPQAMPSSQPSYELIILFMKSSDDEGYKLRLRKVINLSITSDIEWHSPEAKASALRPVAKPGITQVSLLRLLSCEEWWRARCNLLDVVNKLERCYGSVINKDLDSGDTKHLPSTKAAHVLPVFAVYTFTAEIWPALLEFRASRHECEVETRTPQRTEHTASLLVPSFPLFSYSWRDWPLRLI